MLTSAAVRDLAFRLSKTLASLVALPGFHITVLILLRELSVSSFGKRNHYDLDILSLEQAAS